MALSALAPSATTTAPTASIVLGVCALLASAAACLVVAWRPPGTDGDRSRRTPARGAGPGWFDEVRGPRAVLAITIGFVVLLASRWVLLAVAAGALTALWGRFIRDDRADDERRRVEAIAKWLEDLRDTLRASAIGAEEALEQVAHRPPAAIREALGVFLLRRRQGFRTEDALADLADALAHPTSDAAIAAIRLVVSGAAGAGRLYPTVDALAAAARDEVRARERVDRTRAVYQGSMKRLVVIGAVLVAYLRFAAGDLLDAYDSPTGQAVLLLPLGMWAGCIVWLRRLCRYEQPRRYRIGGADVAFDAPSGVVR